LFLGIGSFFLQLLIEPVRAVADWIFLVAFLVLGVIVGFGIIKSNYVSSRKKLSTTIFALSLAFPAAFWFFFIKEEALVLLNLLEEWLKWTILISIIGLGIAYVVKKQLR